MLMQQVVSAAGGEVGGARTRGATRRAVSGSRKRERSEVLVQEGSDECVDDKPADCPARKKKSRLHSRSDGEADGSLEEAASGDSPSQDVDMSLPPTAELTVSQVSAVTPVQQDMKCDIPSDALESNSECLSGQVRSSKFAWDSADVPSQAPTSEAADLSSSSCRPDEPLSANGATRTDVSEEVVREEEEEEGSAAEADAAVLSMVENKIGSISTGERDSSSASANCSLLVVEEESLLLAGSNSAVNREGARASLKGFELPAVSYEFSQTNTPRPFHRESIPPVSPTAASEVADSPPPRHCPAEPSTMPTFAEAAERRKSCGAVMTSRRTSVEELQRITAVPGWECQFLDSQVESPKQWSPSHPSQVGAPDPAWKFRVCEKKLRARLEAVAAAADGSGSCRTLVAVTEAKAAEETDQSDVMEADTERRDGNDDSGNDENEKHSNDDENEHADDDKAKDGKGRRAGEEGKEFEMRTPTARISNKSEAASHQAPRQAPATK